MRGCPQLGSRPKAARSVAVLVALKEAKSSYPEAYRNKMMAGFLIVLNDGCNITGMVMVTWAP